VLEELKNLLALPELEHLQNIHPLVVHFPVAMLPGAALLYYSASLSRRESIAWAAMWMLVLGVLGAVVAVATGLYAAPGVMLAPSVKNALLERHKWVMVGALVFSAGLMLWVALAPPMPSRGRGVFLLLLAALTGLLVTGADYGGRMVFDYNAGGYACGQPIEFTR